MPGGNIRKRANSVIEIVRSGSVSKAGVKEEEKASDLAKGESNKHKRSNSVMGIRGEEIARDVDVLAIFGVKNLFRQNTDVSVQDISGNAALSDVHNPNIIKVLMDAKADISARAIRAIYRNQDIRISGLRESGVDFSGMRCGKSGRTLLHFATDFAMAELLITQKADVNARSKDGITPLMYAPEPVARLLLQHKAKVNACSKKNLTREDGCNTALHNARDPEVVRLLMQCKADPEIKNFNRLTPLALASENRQSSVMKALLQGGADPLSAFQQATTKQQLGGLINVIAATDGLTVSQLIESYHWINNTNILVEKPLIKLIKKIREDIVPYIEKISPSESTDLRAKLTAIAAEQPLDQEKYQTMGEQVGLQPVDLNPKTSEALIAARLKLMKKKYSDYIKYSLTKSIVMLACVAGKNIFNFIADQYKFCTLIAEDHDLSGFVREVTAWRGSVENNDEKKGNSIDDVNERIKNLKESTAFLQRIVDMTGETLKNTEGRVCKLENAQQPSTPPAENTTCSVQPPTSCASSAAVTQPPLQPSNSVRAL
jgi:hypothetical protein